MSAPNDSNNLNESNRINKASETIHHEELAVAHRKRLIQTYLQKLVKEDPNLYYASTAEIARGLHQLIQEHKNRMPIEEQALLKKLSINDIEMILSFH